MNSQFHVRGSWLLLAWLALGLLVLGLAGTYAQPASARVDPSFVRGPLGSSVTFCIEPDPGPAAVFQWRKNGVSLPGETNRCLLLTNLAIADGASYRAAVSDATGALESQEATLQILVNILSGSDEFKGGTSIAAVSNSVRGVSSAATREPSEPLHGRLSTSNSVWYTWTAPASGIVTFDTRGSTYDTVLAVYTGSDLPGVVELVSDDDSGGYHASRVSWNATAGVNYRVAIDGATGETGAYVCNWRLELTDDRLPVITLQPRSLAVPEGGSAVFSVAVTNAVPGLVFQWFHNGLPISKATSSNLTVANVQSADLGRYQLAITNSAGRSVLTAPADLEIGPNPAVVSRDKIAELPSGGGGGGGGGPEDGEAAGFASSSISAGTFSLSAGTVINQRFFSGGTLDRCEPAHCGVAGGASRWFQLSAVSDGICTIDTLGSDVNTILALYLQNFSICTNLYEPLVECNNDVLGSCDQLLVTNAVRERGSRISFFAPAGSVYRAVVDTVGGARGTNLQFHVRFDGTSTVPTNAVALGTTTNCLLQLRGGTALLRVAAPFATPGSTFQWRFNGRRIAGANLDRLLLPSVEYSDAGFYSVAVQSGTSQTVLPGVMLVVLDPCREDGAAGLPVRVVGTSPETLLLESRTSLTSTSAWETIGSIPRAIEPAQWQSGAGAGRFYRARRAGP